jgi:hypothetical protein
MTTSSRVKTARCRRWWMIHSPFLRSLICQIRSRWRMAPS